MVERNPASGGMDILEGSLSPTFSKEFSNDVPSVSGGEKRVEASALSPHVSSEVDSGFDSSSPSPVAGPVPPSPSLYLQVPSSPALSGQASPAGSSFDKKCTQLLAPDGTQGACGEPHQLRRQRGRARKDSKAELGTRLSTVDAVERKSAGDKEDAVGTPEEIPVTQEERCRVENLPLACPF